MTKDTALRLALEAMKVNNNAWEFLADSGDAGFWKAEEQGYYQLSKKAITAVEAALEAKDEKANDELRRLHDLLGKANALARIRANKIDELEQRLTKTEAQLGEAVWNYGELKREQLANQQKTSGSPINTSTALEAKDEPVAWMRTSGTGSPVVTEALLVEMPEMRWNFQQPLYTTPPQRKPLTDEEIYKIANDLFYSNGPCDTIAMCRAIEAAHGIKGET